MAKKNSIPTRIDAEFQKIINKTIAEQLNRKNKRLTSSRVTLAMSRQYKKHPQLLKELLEADFI